MDLEKIRAAAERVARSEGLEVVDVEWKIGKQRFLRVYIDRVAKPGAVISDVGGTLETGEVVNDPFPKISHADCELVSQQVGTILDVEDVVPGGRYTLEVSSPGLERKLFKPQDYERFQGKKVKITLREPVEERRHWEGTLAGFQAGLITLEAAPGKTIQIPYELIQKANLKFEW